MKNRDAGSTVTATDNWWGDASGPNHTSNPGVTGNLITGNATFDPWIGQSGDPESPHFDDQAQRHADVEFKDVAFYREDVEARATRTYHPGD